MDNLEPAEHVPEIDWSEVVGGVVMVLVSSLFGYIAYRLLGHTSLVWPLACTLLAVYLAASGARVVESNLSRVDPKHPRPIDQRLDQVLYALGFSFSAVVVLGIFIAPGKLSLLERGLVAALFGLRAGLYGAALFGPDKK